MRRSALLAAVAVALVAGGALGYVAVTDGDGAASADASVSDFRPIVAVGNESESVPEGARTDVTCTHNEPFPGNAVLEGSMTLARPPGDDGPANATFRITLSAGDDAVTTNGTVSLAPGESAQPYPTVLVDQPDSLSGEDTVTVRAVVRTANRTVATTARTVGVFERNVPCADGREN